MWSDYVIGGAFVAAGLVGLGIVFAGRKRFRLWVAIPALLACAIKGLRMICYLEMLRRVSKEDNAVQMISTMQSMGIMIDFLDWLMMVLLILAVFCLWHGSNWKKI